MAEVAGGLDCCGGSAGGGGFSGQRPGCEGLWCER